MRCWLPALVAMAVVPASAHHPFTPYYDASRPTTVPVVIVELRGGSQPCSNTYPQVGRQ